MAEEAAERVSRWRTLTDASFGLALGLSAFSLTDFPIRKSADIMMAIMLFFMAFTIIIGIWHDIHRILKYPFGISFAALNFMLIFLVVIMPFTFRLIFLEIGEVGKVAATLYPIDVAASYTVLAVMSHSFIRHNRDSLPKDIIGWGKVNRVICSIIAMVYAASLFIPPDVRIIPYPPELQLLQRITLMGMAWPIAIILGAIYEKALGVKWTSR